MADEINGAATVESLISVVGVDNLKLLRDAIRMLPPQPIKDLLSNSVCERCVLRLFGLHEQVCSHPSVSALELRTMLHDLIKSEGEASGSLMSTPVQEIEICCLCLGILQFVYSTDGGNLVKKDSASSISAAIQDFVKKEGHEIDGFSLEISLPQNVVGNEEAVRSYISKKYNTESWFPEKFPSITITSKDFLKLAVTSPLEKLLDVRSKVDSFRIRLTYSTSDASTRNQHMKENNGGYKRRKTDDNGDSKKYCEHQKIEGSDLAGNSSTECVDHGVGLLHFGLPKVDKCCSLVTQCCRTSSIYIGGRYLKRLSGYSSLFYLQFMDIIDDLAQGRTQKKYPEYSRNVSQTRWIIDDERMGEASIEELIGGNVLPICQGDSYKFHAAGREDIDVRMLGTGRPFLIEIQNARLVPSDLLVKSMEMKINSLESKLVNVKNLKVLGSEAWELMREGEAEKQKQYVALVWISRPLDNEDVQALSSLTDLQVLQKTPVRVLHRRSPIERGKIIHWMKIERISGNSQYFLLHLCTQAGTYIKEFVHGDLGRTHPSVGSILKCRAEILQLDVTDVKMDCFQA